MGQLQALFRCGESRLSRFMDSEHDAARKDLIIEHSQFPRGQRELAAASHEGRGENPFCGDRIHVQLQVDARGRIADAACLARGCAISMASASMLADTVTGRSLDEAARLIELVRNTLTAEVESRSDLPGDLDALRLVRRYPARVKCATLAWHALQQALAGGMGSVSTE